MKRLDSFDFDARPSRSQYAPVLDALVDEKVPAVVLERGEDFPQGVSITSVQAGVRAVIKKQANLRTRTRIVDDNHLAVGIHPVQNPAKRKRRELAAA